MAKRFPKRSRKERGHRTHGYGAGKKHRGKGNKGGKGYAWDKHLWVWSLKYDPGHFGKCGFHTPGQVANRPETANVGLLDAMAEKLVAEKLASMRGASVEIDCAKLGIGKVLGSGKVTRPLILTNCTSFTESAKEKVESAGGSIAAPPGKKE